VVVLVTARNWRSVGEIAELAGVGGLAICSNGAVDYDLATGVVRRSHAVASDVVRRFVARCRSSSLDACFGWETAAGAYRSPRYHELALASPTAAGYPHVYLRDIEVLEDVADDHEVTKLLVRHATMPVPDLLAAVQELDDGGAFTFTTSGGDFVEIMAAGVTKAFALEQLCADLGIDQRDVVAVGDQPNDLPMLSWAGRGVAMGNSHPLVLEAVDERTATNADDGLALVLESLL
jgi:Cof subfamily protein (haloacid dehalogenase superfamily)